jgi:cytochrome c-type biogenesis protein CcmH/NrfG
VARGTQHRKRRPAANARKPVAAVAAERPRKQRPPQWQEELFFQRLRVHAKWAFVLLAAVFGLGFVFLGIGSGSNGITDALQNAFNFGSSSSGASVSSLEKKTQKHPFDAKAWRDLATAYETKQNTDGAIRALAQYVSLRPKDASALAELGSEYSTRADAAAREAQAAQQDASSATPPAAIFAPPATTPLGRAFNDTGALKDPIATAVQTLANDRATTATAKYQSAIKSAEGTYQQLAKLTPNDANAQLQLGQVAASAQDANVAIAAYQRFLKLAPSDPLAPQVRSALKTLKAQAAVTTPGAASG